jgi:hypothetical protein
VAEQIPFRAPPELMKLLRECARRHGRSVAEELRIAVELHVTRSVVEALPRKDVRVMPDVRAALSQLVEHAYRPGKPDDLLQKLLEAQAELPK